MNPAHCSYTFAPIPFTLDKLFMEIAELTQMCGWKNTIGRQMNSQHSCLVVQLISSIDMTAAVKFHQVNEDNKCSQERYILSDQTIKTNGRTGLRYVMQVHSLAFLISSLQRKSPFFCLNSTTALALEADRPATRCSRCSLHEFTFTPTKLDRQIRHRYSYRKIYKNMNIKQNCPSIY